MTRSRRRNGRQKQRRKVTSHFIYSLLEVISKILCRRDRKADERIKGGKRV